MLRYACCIMGKFALNVQFLQPLKLCSLKFLTARDLSTDMLQIESLMRLLFMCSY